MMRALHESLLKAFPHADIRAGADLSQITSFRTGGQAGLLLSAQSGEEVLYAVRAAQELGVRYHVFGNATNMLVSDRGLDALVIRIAQGLSAFAREGDSFLAQAGAPLAAFAKATVEAGFSGLEWAAGIPGSVGGAVAMNAGAYGGEIARSLVEVTALAQGEIQTITVESKDFGYRKSRFRAPERIVLSARFSLIPDDGTALSRMQEFNRVRREKQPLQFASAGSTFKRPVGNYAGGLIEAAGLKGTRVGGAQVSEQHAGFIVNTGGATSADVYALIRLVQARVYENSGVRLEPEVMLLGDFDEGNEPWSC